MNSFDTLHDYISKKLAHCYPEASIKIEEALDEYRGSLKRAQLFKTFALAPRWIKSSVAHSNFTLSETDNKTVSTHFPTLFTGTWTPAQLARLSILLTVQTYLPSDEFNRELETLFNSADTSELKALYQSLPFLRQGDLFNSRGREGARSNLYSVFLSIAHNNPYPATYFDEEGWNQLILKAVFNSCPLNDIIGLDKRNNVTLAKMLSTYVRERWVAHRTVPWDIWRCIGPYAKEVGAMDLFEQALNNNKKSTRLAAALALKINGSKEANTLLADKIELSKQIELKDWSDLAREFQVG